MVSNIFDGKKICVITGKAIVNKQFTGSTNVLIGYDKATHAYFADRTSSGNVAFEKGFAAMHTAPRSSTKRCLWHEQEQKCIHCGETCVYFFVRTL